MESAFVFLLLVALSQAGIPLSRGLDSRMMNGQDVPAGEIPYQVSVQLRGSNVSHFCSGSVLNKNYVITTASCLVDKKASDLQVSAASVNLNDPKSVHPAVEIIIHEQFDPNKTQMNDIALIRVNVPFIASKTLGYVSLPESGQDVPARTVATISGWGLPWIIGSPTLRRTKMIVTAQNICSGVYHQHGQAIHDSQFCAQVVIFEDDFCWGENGEPLIVRGKLVGLKSWAWSCSTTMFPIVFTKVPHYIDWIHANAF